MARPPSFSVEEFQALISMTLDLKESSGNEAQGHSRISSPSLLNEGGEFGRSASRLRVVDLDETVRARKTKSEPLIEFPRMRRDSEVNQSLWVPQFENTVNRVCECDCPCGCGYVGKWLLESNGRCERCQRKCQTTSAPRKRRFSLSASTPLGLRFTSPRTASPSPSASHAASSNSLLSKVNRAIRRISFSSTSTPVSTKENLQSRPTSFIGAHFKRNTTHSTHTPTLTPTKEERSSLEKSEVKDLELEGPREEEKVKRLGADEAKVDDSKSHSSQPYHRYHYPLSQPESLRHRQQTHLEFHQQFDPTLHDPFHSPTSFDSSFSNPVCSSPATPSEPATPSSIGIENQLINTPHCHHQQHQYHHYQLPIQQDYHQLHEQHNYTRNQPVYHSQSHSYPYSHPYSYSDTPYADFNSNNQYADNSHIQYPTFDLGHCDMLSIAPVASHHGGMLTPSVEDVVGCMGNSSDEGGKRERSRERERVKILGRERAREKSREREREKSKEREMAREKKERSREREREKKEHSNSKSKRESASEKKKSKIYLNSNASTNASASVNSSTNPSSVPTPTKLQFSFPLGMFSPSSGISETSPSTPSSAIFGGSGVEVGVVNEAEDPRGRKLSVLGRLRKGFSISGRSKHSAGSASPIGVSSGYGGGVGAGNAGAGTAATNRAGYGEADPLVRRESVLAREREEMERDVDLRFRNGTPLPGSACGHEAEVERGAEGGKQEIQGDEDEEGSVESTSLSVEVARRGGGEGGLPSVCVTFATSSASGSECLSTSGSVSYEDGERSSEHGSGGWSSGSTGVGSRRTRRRKKKKANVAPSNAETSPNAELSLNLGSNSNPNATSASSFNVSMNTMTSPSAYSMASAAYTQRERDAPVPSGALTPRESIGNVSSTSEYSCSSYVGSVSSFFAADAIAREKARSSDVSGSSGGTRSKSSRNGGGGGNVSSSSGGKKSMDGASFLSLDLSGESEGSASDDTSRGVGSGKGGDGGSFIEFGEDVGGEDGSRGNVKERKRRGGATSTPNKKDRQGKKRTSIVLFRGSSSQVSVNGAQNTSDQSTHNQINTPQSAKGMKESQQSANGDTVSSKANSITSRSDISIFSGSTFFEFAPVVGSTGGHDNQERNTHHAPFGSPMPHSPAHHSHHNHRRAMEPSIRVFDVDGDSLIDSSIGGHDAISISARSADAFSVDGMSVNSDDTDYIPFLPLVLQHERLQKTLRKPVSMESVVHANAIGKGMARSVRSVSSVASMNSVGTSRSGSLRMMNDGEEGGRQRRSSAVRLDPRSAHVIGSKNKAAERLGLNKGNSEVSLGGGSSSSSSRKRLPAHVSASIAGVRIPAASNVSRAASISSSVGTEDSSSVISGPGKRVSALTLRVQTDLDLDLGARRVVVCGSGLDAGVEELREGRISMSSEDAASVLVSEDAHSQFGTVVDTEEEALDVTPTPTPRAAVFAVNSLEVTPSLNRSTSFTSSKKTFIGPQTLSPQPSVASIRRTPSRQVLKSTPPRAPPSDPLPLPPLSPTTTSSSSSGPDNRSRHLSTGSVAGVISSRMAYDVNSDSSGASMSVSEGEKEVETYSSRPEKEDEKKRRMRLSVQSPKDLWRARKKSSAVGMDPEPRRDASSSSPNAEQDQPTRATTQTVSPAANEKPAVVFPTLRSLSFSSPTPQNRHERQQDAGGSRDQDQIRDGFDGLDDDSALILENKAGSSRSVPSSTHSDEEKVNDDDEEDETVDPDSDSMRQLLAANTSANAAIHSNLDVHKIGMGRQVIIPSPPTKKKSTNRLTESERMRTKSSLGIGSEWTLGLGETEVKDGLALPARHASYSTLFKKMVKPAPVPEVVSETSSQSSKRSSQVSESPSSTPSRARTQSESALRALNSVSAKIKKTRSVLPDFDDWTLSLPLPSPRDYERSRKVSELGSSIGLAAAKDKTPKEVHRHSAAPVASKRHTLDQKKRRQTLHPIVRVEDVDSGVDLEVARGDDDPSESDEDDLRTPPLNANAAQAFVVPGVVSLIDSLGMPESERSGQGEVRVLDVQPDADITILEEDTHAMRARSNLAKLDALSADLKRFNEMLRSGHPGSSSRKNELSLRSVSSNNAFAKLSPPPEPFSYSVQLKHVRSCEPFESKEPENVVLSAPKNALYRTSRANLRDSLLSSLPISENQSGGETILDNTDGGTSDRSTSTFIQGRTSQSSMKRQSNPRISLSKSRSSLSPVIQSLDAAEEEIDCSSIDVQNIELQPTAFAANDLFGPAKWGKSSSLGRSVISARISSRAPLPFAPPAVEPATAASSTLAAPTNDRRPKKLSDGISDISPTLRNAVSSIELGRIVPIAISAQHLPSVPKRTTTQMNEQRETSKSTTPPIATSRKLAPPSLSVQISPLRRSSIILADLTPTSATSSAFPTPLASSFPIPPTTLPSLPLDFELGAIKMAQAVPPTPPPDSSSRSVKSQKGRPSTSSSTSTVTASVVQRMKERLEGLGKTMRGPTPSTNSAEMAEHDETDQSSLCSGAYYSARSSFSEDKKGDD